jgi:hypothetical protein
MEDNVEHRSQLAPGSFGGCLASSDPDNRRLLEMQSCDVERLSVELAKTTAALQEAVARAAAAEFQLAARQDSVPLNDAGAVWRKQLDLLHAQLRTAVCCSQPRCVRLVTLCLQTCQARAERAELAARLENSEAACVGAVLTQRKAECALEAVQSEVYAWVVSCAPAQHARSLS